jgi:hypothetical protein
MFEDGSLLGEICHICAQSFGGPRYNPALSDEELHSLENLILLCRKHHKLIDDQAERFTESWLKEAKRRHEALAATTPVSVLVRLVEALAPDVPENWEDRPGAPQFKLSLASNRPESGSWTFEMNLMQVDGGDIGRLEARCVHGDHPQDWKKLELYRARYWRIDPYSLQPTGSPFEVQIRFWWAGAQRGMTFHWDREHDFQKAKTTTSHW